MQYKSSCQFITTFNSENLPDAINNDCKKCSATQKSGADKMMHHIIDNDPQWWSDLEAK